jgi:hypothetical protein
MSPSNEFHLFPSLPPELRHKIWSFALSFPRTVNVSCRSGPFQRGVPRTAKFGSIDRPPAVLHVCHESRSEALRIYKPAFQAAACTKYIFVDFSKDTIKSSQNILQFLGKSELQNIQNMVLELRDPAYFLHFNLDILKVMQPNLRELALLIEIGDEYRGPRTRDMLEALTLDLTYAMEGDWISPPNVTIVDVKSGRVEKVSKSDCLVPLDGLVT